MSPSIDASHIETVVQQSRRAAENERWRREDARRTPPAAPPTPPAKKAAMKAIPTRKIAPPKKARKPDLPPGSLVLSPPEVAALDRLLATHPDLQ